MGLQHTHVRYEASTRSAAKIIAGVFWRDIDMFKLRVHYILNLAHRLHGDNATTYILYASAV